MAQREQGDVAKRAADRDRVQRGCSGSRAGTETADRRDGYSQSGDRRGGEDADTKRSSPASPSTIRLFSLTDIGKYNVAVCVCDARPGGKAAGTRSLSHDKVTEIYYMLRGSRQRR